DLPRRAAVVHLVLLDLGAQRLDLGLRQIPLCTIASAEHLVCDQTGDQADQGDHDQDFDQAETGLSAAARQRTTDDWKLLLHGSYPTALVRLKIGIRMAIMISATTIAITMVMPGTSAASNRSTVF